MQKKGAVNILTFIIVLAALFFIVLFGTLIMNGLNDTVQSSLYNDMINDIKTEVDLLLYEGAGATKVLTLRPSNTIDYFCFVDYGVSPLGALPEFDRVEPIANQINSMTDVQEKQNLIILNKEGFEVFYVGAITVESSGGIDCFYYSPKVDLLLKSQGQKILIKER